jgi:glucose/arabinose dehydrogenase
VFGLLTPVASAQLPTPVTINSTFTNPVYGTSAPGTPQIMHVVQQGGLVRQLNVQTGVIERTTLNMASVTGAAFISGGEQGLLGLAFHPDYQSNGLMYVKYTYNNGQDGGGLRVEQYQLNQSTGVADPSTRRTVLQWDHDPTFGNTNHNAGWIGFNPQATGAARNNLYVMTGDGGGGNDPNNFGQNTNVFQAKTLRVDVGGGLTAANPNYAIPAGNMTGANVRPEVYSYGLRNPYRASFDRTTGNLYIGDVGQGAREEINFIPNTTNGQPTAGGQNFGWRLREGTIQTPGPVGGPRPPGNVDPIHEYTRDIGTSVTGGYVYRGNVREANGTPLDGTYFFGDFVSGRIWSFRVNAAGTGVTDYQERTTQFGFTAGQLDISSFAEDGFGNLYVIDYDFGAGNGSVIRLVPVPEPAGVGLCCAAGVAAAAGWRRCRRRPVAG